MLNVPRACVQTVPRIRGILRSWGVLQLLDIWPLGRRPHPVRTSAPFPRSRSSSRSSLITCLNKDIATSGERFRTCSATSSRTYAPPSDQDIARAAVDISQYDHVVPWRWALAVRGRCVGTVTGTVLIMASTPPPAITLPVLGCLRVHMVDAVLGRRGLGWVGRWRVSMVSALSNGMS